MSGGHGGDMGMHMLCGDGGWRVGEGGAGDVVTLDRADEVGWEWLGWVL